MTIVGNTPDRLVPEHRRTVRPLLTGLRALLRLATALITPAAPARAAADAVNGRLGHPSPQPRP